MRVKGAHPNREREGRTVTDSGVMSALGDTPSAEPGRSTTGLEGRGGALHVRERMLSWTSRSASIILPRSVILMNGDTRWT